MPKGVPLVQPLVWWALVKWCGFDITTKELRPWDDSWVRDSWLTPDLRRKAPARKRAAAETAAGEDEAAPDGARRRSPRVAGLIPSTGLA